MMWQCIVPFSKKNYLLRYLSYLSLLNLILALTLSLLLKRFHRKLKSPLVAWSFLLPSLYFISLNLPYDLAWNTDFMSALVLRGAYLEMLDKLQKRVCRTVGLSLTTFHKPWVCRRNVTSLSLFISITLVDIHLNRLNWFRSLFS